MADATAMQPLTTVSSTSDGFSVTAFQRVDFEVTFTDGVFDLTNPQLAECYQPLRRCLAVVDYNVLSLYGEQIRQYFAHHNIKLTIHKSVIGEKEKEMDTMLGIVDSIVAFGLFKSEPVLIIGGGLVLDVTGFACASYRRGSNFICIPTTLISLVDASVSDRVGVNYKEIKNALGAFRAPVRTFIDLSFLRTLLIPEVRNGFAELVKIASTSDQQSFVLMEKWCKELIGTGFGMKNGADERIARVGTQICRVGVREYLNEEAQSMNKARPGRAVEFGHSWSRIFELIPEPPLRHGHAVSIDMAFSATIAHRLKYITTEEYHRFLGLLSATGLSLDVEHFTPSVLKSSTAEVLKVRDGKLRAVMPVSPMGKCTFLVDLPMDKLLEALEAHKSVVGEYPRGGAGVDAFVSENDDGCEVERNDGRFEQKA